MTRPDQRPVLFVTGASAGIGAAVARMAAADWDLALGYHSDRAGAKAVAADCAAKGARTALIGADLSQPEGVEAAFSQLDEAFDGLDALVNNAGVVDLAQPVADYEAARVVRMVATNLTGPILVAGAAVRRMSTALGGNGGGIVNVSSEAARHAAPGQYVDYAATKAAIDTLTRGLAIEVAGDGICVNAVRPGIIDTGIHAKGGVPGRAATLGPHVPAGRAGTPDEVAQAVLWLLSEESSYVTGALLDVAGGR
ncbi:SDR family oxidoreductase [Anianabacter salinae]|uniref:SDR family oxidoreductase n=1 Tax=Anianabacter salinae TaxID=2851023 RepID=UPI00225E1057|nr:SDR family oxidoreductase [Anianabacter salinae]MBV0914053.1 SDR family oxidoreductase [Anianabacter salinae]